MGLESYTESTNQLNSPWWNSLNSSEMICACYCSEDRKSQWRSSRHSWRNSTHRWAHGHREKNTETAYPYQIEAEDLLNPAAADPRNWLQKKWVIVSFARLPQQTSKALLCFLLKLRQKTHKQLQHHIRLTSSY